MIQTTPGRYHGHATLSLPPAVEAGSTVDFEITFTVGDFGIDDSGSLKLCWRFASDIGTPQFDDPGRKNFLQVSTNADCELHPRFDPKANTRPWGRTVYVKVQKGFLEPGDRILFRFANTEMQTFAERAFRFRLFVDDVATCVYNEVDVAPAIDLVPGPAARLRLYVPSLLPPGESFALRLVAEDRWANPTTFPGPVTLTAEGPVAGLPESVGGSPGGGFGPGGFGPGGSPGGVARQPEAVVVDALSASSPGVVRIVAEWDGHRFESNPLVIDSDAEGLLAWADMHGQSGETIGTGTIDEYFRFARDLACVDIAGHQGNDFQITREFWSRLQSVTAAFNEEGRFITFPGYEWSGNTALGGDRNVYFRTEGRHIRRSSHALCPDPLDAADDCTSVEALFAALSDEDCLVVPHVGGRYADVFRHDPRLERSVEVHSAWGTFEWMIHDAFSDGHIAGIVAMSDGHKGRPGASHPGRGKFGSYGGLTCMLLDELSRDAAWDALHSRRHYATTGTRTVLTVSGTLRGGSAGAGGTERAGAPIVMGARVDGGDAERVRLSVRYVGTAPILAVDVFNGLDEVDHRAPFNAVGDRILVWWSGSLRRGRGRQIDWTGSCAIDGGEISDVQPVNFHSPDRPLLQPEANRLEWESFTTGGVSGFIGTLSHPREGTLRLETARLAHHIELSSLGSDPVVVPAGGVDARLRVMRLPTENAVREMSFEAEYPLSASERDAYYLRITQEDGTMTWSSPIYIENGRKDESV